MACSRRSRSVSAPATSSTPSTSDRGGAHPERRESMVVHPPLLDRTWAEALTEAAERYGDRAAFEFDGGWRQTLTFRQGHETSQRLAAALAALGIGAGDRVAVLSPGSAVWPLMQTACSQVGAIIVPVNTRYRSDELSHVLSLAEPALVVLIERYHQTDYLDLVRR